MADWSWRAAALVAAGGALGCVLRYAVGVWLTRADWPWGTLAVNLLGSFVIALFMFGLFERGVAGPDARLFVVVGVLGGFTTMSSFAFETMSFLDDAELLRAGAYLMATVGGSLVMAYLGMVAARALPGGS